MTTDHSTETKATENPTSPNSLSPIEQASLDQYIKSHKTAVLSIMFTDIAGYTRITEEQGDRLAGELRKQHDALLKSIIEQDGKGLVLKYIGDAVMAVFAEPSAATEKAIEIQRALRRLNADQPEMPQLRVRIGMHLGQVTVEGDVQADIFGRHVNRAARIEGLADGGQVLMSFSIYDSAKSWLQGQASVASVHHGKYQLKGIDEPVDLYELYEPNITQPKAPEKGRIAQHGQRYRWLIAAALVLGIGLTLLVQSYKAVEFWLEPFYPQNLRFADGTPVQLAGNKEDDRRQVLNKLSAGPKLIYYPVGQNLRYFAELELERGLNQLKPGFREWRLPSIQLRLERDDLQPTHYLKQQEFKLLQLVGERMQPVTLSLALEVQRRDEGEQVSNAFRWSISQDGRLLAEGSDTVTQLKSAGIERGPRQSVWEGAHYGYWLYYYTGKGAFDLTLSGAFSAAKPKAL